MAEPQAPDYFVPEHPVTVPPHNVRPDSQDSFFGAPGSEKSDGTMTPNPEMPVPDIATSSPGESGISHFASPPSQLMSEQGEQTPIAVTTALPSMPMSPPKMPVPENVHYMFGPSPQVQSPRVMVTSPPVQSPRDSGNVQYVYRSSPGLPSPPKPSGIADAIHPPPFPSHDSYTPTLDLLETPAHIKSPLDPGPPTQTEQLYQPSPDTLQPSTISPINNSLLETPIQNPLLDTPRSTYSRQSYTESSSQRRGQPPDPGISRARSQASSSSFESPSPRTERLPTGATPMFPQPDYGHNLPHSHRSSSRVRSPNASHATSESMSERGHNRSGDHSGKKKNHKRDPQAKKDLVNFIIAEENRVADIRRQLATAQAQLANESRRATDTEAASMRGMQALKDAVDAKALAERERTRVTEELALYRAQHTLALAEITRAQDILDKAEEARAEAFDAASRARGKARKMRDERQVSKAREQGRKEGFREGVQWGRRVGLKEGRTQALAMAEGSRSQSGDSGAPIQLANTEDGITPIMEEREPTEYENDGQSLLERRSIRTDREREYETPIERDPRQTHGGSGTFSPVGATRPALDATQAGAMMAGAAFMPAAHAALDAGDGVVEDEGRRTPRAFHAPPDNWVPTAGPDGRFFMPPPNEMATAGSAVSSFSNAAGHRPFSGDGSSFAGSAVSANTGYTGVTGVSRAAAPTQVRDFSAPTSVPQVSGRRQDGRLSIIPEVGSSMEATPIPLPRPIPVPGSPSYVESPMDDTQAFTPPPARPREQPREKARGIMHRIAKKMGGGLSRASEPSAATFRDMPEDEGGWVDINGNPSPIEVVAPVAIPPPAPPPMIQPQRTGSAGTYRKPVPSLAPGQPTGRDSRGHQRIISSASSAPAISVIAPSSRGSMQVPSARESRRLSRNPGHSHAPSGPEPIASRPHSHAPSMVSRDHSPQPSQISRANSPGRHVINLDEPLPPPIIERSPAPSNRVLMDDVPRPQSYVPQPRSDYGGSSHGHGGARRDPRADMRRQGSGSSVASRHSGISGYGRYNPDEYLDPAILASPAPESNALPTQQPERSGYVPPHSGHRHPTRAGSAESGEQYGYPSRSSRWEGAKRFNDLD